MRSDVSQHLSCSMKISLFLPIYRKLLVYVGKQSVLIVRSDSRSEDRKEHKGVAGKAGGSEDRKEWKGQKGWGKESRSEDRGQNALTASAAAHAHVNRSIERELKNRSAKSSTF